MNGYKSAMKAILWGACSDTSPKDCLTWLWLEITCKLPPALPNKYPHRSHKFGNRSYSLVRILGGEHKLSIHKSDKRQSSSQRNQVRDASQAAQRWGCGNLPLPSCRLRKGAPKTSWPVDTIDALLASAGGGVINPPPAEIEPEPPNSLMAA